MKNTNNPKQKERTIENFLNNYNTYKIGIKNCQKQLDYMLPSLVARYDSDGRSCSYYIANNTERVALDRITSKRALFLLEEIEEYKVILACIDNALAELSDRQKQFVKYRYFEGLKMYEVKDKMGLAEERTLYRIRRQVLDRFEISLAGLMNLK
jgi:DNA-directed RNA polymerase specialized sigma subunit